MHTVKYYDGVLCRLQRKANALRYDIDHDADYIAACACLPATLSGRTKKANPAILPLLYRVTERLQSVKNCKF